MKRVSTESIKSTLAGGNLPRYDIPPKEFSSLSEAIQSDIEDIKKNMPSDRDINHVLDITKVIHKEMGMDMLSSEVLMDLTDDLARSLGNISIDPILDAFDHLADLENQLYK